MRRLERAFECAALIACVHCTLAMQQASAQSQSQDPADALFVEGLAAVGVHRELAFLDLRLRYRHRIYASASEALRANYAGLGVIAQTSPVFIQPGVYTELAPTSFLRVTAAYQSVIYFGVLDSLRPLAGCDAVAVLRPTDARCDFQSTGSHVPQASDYGHRVWSEADLQTKLGRLLAYGTFSAERWWFRTGWSAGPAYDSWYNPLYSLPQRRADTVLTSNAGLFVETLTLDRRAKLSLLLGATSNLAYAMGTDYLMHRAGPAVVLRAPAGLGLRDLVLALLVHLYTHDRYMQGPLPFVGLLASASTGSFP